MGLKQIKHTCIFYSFVLFIFYKSIVFLCKYKTLSNTIIFGKTCKFNNSWKSLF